MITEQDVSYYKENGLLLVEGLYSPEEVEEMHAGIENIIRKAAMSKYDSSLPWQGDYLPPEELKKLVLKGFHDIHFQEACFTKALMHPNMRAVVSKLIGPNVQLHHSKMLVKPPENGAMFPLHQDHPYFPHENHSMMAAYIYLDDSDMDNGCMCAIPKSFNTGPMDHRGRYFLDQKEYPLSMATPYPAKAGSALFFNYLTIHGTGLNRSKRNSRNILFQFRDPADQNPDDKHINWGQGMMICGSDPVYRAYSNTYTSVS